MYIEKSGKSYSFDELQDKSEYNKGISVNYYSPSADLSDVIKYYWIVEVNDTSGDNRMAKITPSGFPELIFHFGDPVYINTCKGSIIKEPTVSIIAGQITQAITIDMNKSLNCLCVKLHEWSLSALFGINSMDFVNQAVCLDDLMPQSKRTLLEQLSGASGDLERVNIIEQYLRPMVKKYRDCVSLTTIKFVEAIRANNRKQIGHLAQDFHISGRTLQRRFRDDIGITAKMFYRIIRFNKAYHLIKNHKDISFQDICFQLGYYDLPHLINEFRYFSGKSPIQYFKNENIYNNFFAGQV